MKLLENLQAQLRRFDDEAFVTLANKGLLRRAYKDLETLQVSIVRETGEALAITVGAQQIQLDARGPASASCNCSAAGVCQHILAACLWLQRMTEETTPSEVLQNTSPGNSVSNDENTSSSKVSLSDSHDTVIGFGFSELLKHAGKPGYRWAWQFVQDLDAENGLMVAGDKYLIIGFSHPRISFRCMGNDLESMIADNQSNHVAKYRVAAILAYQQANGVQISAPETNEKPRTANLDLGKDHAAPETTDDAKNESRIRLRNSIKQLLLESIELGLSHLSMGIHERYSTLSVWAQGAEYYRLALLLRRLADHVELLLERAGNADEHRLLDEMTLAYGLLAALDAADKKNHSPSYLIGRARNQYEAVTKLELIGLGASPWRSASGYIGLTMLFWSITDRCFLSCTDARPESQRGFNPVARYKAAGPWSGLGAPSQTTGNRVQLTGAQINALGRISTSEGTNATVQKVSSTKELLASLEVCSSWNELQQMRTTARQSLLAEPQPMRDWIALKPTKFGEARFDQAQQILIWPIFDNEGQCINIELAYSEFNSPAIDRIEKFDMPMLSNGSVLIARIRNSNNGLVADPLSLIHPEAGVQASLVDALYFDSAPESSMMAKAISRLRSFTGRSRVASVNPALHLVSLPPILREFRNWLLRYGERGISELASGRARKEFDEYFLKLRTEGFSGFKEAADMDISAAETLLQSHYICQQYMRLLDSQSEES